MYHSCMYIHVPCSYCTVTPLCASVARLVSGVVWYSEAPRPRVARRRSSRPERVGVCCFKLHWWIAWRARDFRLIGDWVSTEHSGRVRPLCSNIRDTSRFRRKSSGDSRVCAARCGGRCGERTEIRETLTEIASRVARRRSGDSSIKRLFQPCSLGGTGRVGGFHTAQGSYPMRYGVST